MDLYLIQWLKLVTSIYKRLFSSFYETFTCKQFEKTHLYFKILIFGQNLQVFRHQHQLALSNLESF